MGLASSSPAYAAKHTAVYDAKHVTTDVKQDSKLGKDEVSRPWPPTVEGRFYQVAVAVNRLRYTGKNGNPTHIPITRPLTARMFEVLQDHAFCYYRIVKLMRCRDTNHLLLWIYPKNTAFLASGQVLCGTAEDDVFKFENFDDMAGDTWMEGNIWLNSEEEMNVEMMSWKRLKGEELAEAERLRRLWRERPDEFKGLAEQKVDCAGIRDLNKGDHVIPVAKKGDPPKLNKKRNDKKRRTEDEMNKNVKRPFGRSDGKRYVGLFDCEKSGPLTSWQRHDLQSCLQFTGLQASSIEKPGNGTVLVAILAPVVPNKKNIQFSSDPLQEIERLKENERVHSSQQTANLLNQAIAMGKVSGSVSLVYWEPATYE